MNRKLVTLTTVDIANYLNVNYITVIRWIDRGKLKAHKLPLRGDRRVEVQDFVAFLRENKLPIPNELSPYLRRVLIVDDDKSIAMAMQRTLNQAGFVVKIACDGFTAGQMVGVFQPVVMTLDLKMPGLDGMQVLRQLQAGEHQSLVKVLVVSGVTRAELDEALAVGADDILEKPFKNDVLVQKVTALAGMELLVNRELKQ